MQTSLLRAGTAAFGLVLVGCGSHGVGSLDGPEQGDVDPPPAGNPTNQWSIETFASPLETQAGTEVLINCVVSEGRFHLSNVGTRVNVDHRAPNAPPPETLGTSEGATTFTPTTVGTYVVRCETTDGVVTDPGGITVNVHPGVPAVVETTIAPHVAQTGAPIDVVCEVFDGNDNPIDRDELAERTHLVVPSSFLRDPPVGEGFVIRGTEVGDHEIACAYEGVVDVTPEVLTITSGIPADTQTVVSQSELDPGETATVSCIVTDAYGNVLDGYATSLLVMTEDGRTPGEGGMVLDGDSVSAVASGTYFVACMVDGYFAADESPAEIVVNPDLPHDWIVEIPSQDCYWLNRGLPILHLVLDEWGNIIDPADYRLAVWMTDAAGNDRSDAFAMDAEGTVYLIAEGDFILWVDLDPSVPQSPTSTIEAVSVPVFVDSTPPVIDITSPARSAQLLDSASTVIISGTVSDAISAIESAELNGSPLGFTAGTLSIPLSVSESSVWGLNIITGSAVDECGNRRVIAQSYLRSGQYFTAATSPNSGARATSGIVARLNQPVVDDHNRNDLDDLASIGESAIQAIDFDGLLPAGTSLVYNGLDSCSGCWEVWLDEGYQVIRDSDPQNRVLWGGPWINELTAVDGGIYFDITVDYLHFPLEAWACERNCDCAFCGCVAPTVCLPTSGWMQAWAGAAGSGSAAGMDAYGQLNVSRSGSSVTASMQSLTVNTAGLYLNLDCGWADFLCDIILDTVIPMLEGIIVDALTDVINAEMPPLIQDFIEQFALDTSIDIPAPLAMQLNLSSSLDYLDFDGPAGSGNGELGLFTQIYPSARGATIPSTARGAIRRRASTSDAAGDAPTFSSFQYSFGITLEDDVLNQTMWALWYGGGLELNLAEIGGLADGFDLSGVQLTISGTEPPVVMPGGGDCNGSVCQVKFGLGDAYVDATVDLVALLGSEASGAPPLHIGMYLSALMGGFVDLDPYGPDGILGTEDDNQILVAIDTEPEIHVEVVAIDDEGYQGLMTDLFAGLLRLLVPELLAGVVGSIPIPKFDLSGVGGLPAGTVLELANGSLSRPNTSGWCLGGSEDVNAGHLCFTGNLQ